MGEERCFTDFVKMRIALTDKNCTNCSFRKTTAQFEAGREKYKEKEIAFLTYKKENPDN